MDTISELKPLFMRFFQEVDTLNEKIKEQQAEIRKLKAENDIYAKVIRNEVHEPLTPSAPSSTPVDSESIVEDGETEHSQNDMKHIEVKRGRKRKYETEGERREKRKEYNRNYRQKQKSKQEE